MSRPTSTIERISVGGRLPNVPLAELHAGQLRPVWPQQAFGGRRAIIVGSPAAFSPVCSRLHVPGFVDSVPSLRQSGYDEVVCVTPDNPWALEAWAGDIDPQRRIRFLSDGNMKFGRALGLTTKVEDLFLGECFERFVLIVRNCFVEKVSVETSPVDVRCTSAAACLLAA